MALSMAFSNARAGGASLRVRKGEPRSAGLSADSAAPDLQPDSQADTQADLVRRMTAVLAMERPGSTAEALRLLRQEFADYPLALRLVALAASMRTWP